MDPNLFPVVQNVIQQLPDVPAWKTWIPFASTLIGTFLGAYLAYRLALIRERREEGIRIEREGKEKEKKDYASLLTAHMALLNQWHIIESTRRIFEPFANDPARVLKMPLTIYEVQPLRIPFENLGYVMLKDADFLQELHLSELRCLNCLDLIRTFSQMRLSSYKPPKPDEIDADRTIKPDSETGYVIKVLENTANEIYASLKRCPLDLYDQTNKVAEFTNANFPNFPRLNKIQPKVKV